MEQFITWLRGAKASSVLLALLYPSHFLCTSSCPLPAPWHPLPICSCCCCKTGRWNADTVRLVASWTQLREADYFHPRHAFKPPKSAHSACHSRWAQCFPHVPGGIIHEDLSPANDGAHSGSPPSAHLPKVGFHWPCDAISPGEICSSGSRLQEFWLKVKISIHVSDGGESGL